MDTPPDKGAGACGRYVQEKHNIYWFLVKCVYCLIYFAVMSVELMLYIHELDWLVVWNDHTICKCGEN